MLPTVLVYQSTLLNLSNPTTKSHEESSLQRIDYLTFKHGSPETNSGSSKPMFDAGAAETFLFETNCLP
ncbi:hypothetical protein CEXT_387391 [Caerostris extrusa]|uniref:Uncharacterized protein n=1 Tax=Caerostris extrusa TaxID=172846 RepID=A0AAV4P2U3_CAEEX|nr:hypothetical protein CEXT_387391 [Caerostris extrusa]